MIRDYVRKPTLIFFLALAIHHREHFQVSLSFNVFMTKSLIINVLVSQRSFLDI